MMFARTVSSVFAALWLCLGVSRAAAGTSFDHAAYDAVLKQYVTESGLVDYRGIERDERFGRYIASLEEAEPDTWSRDAQLAFWINAYNALTIQHVIDRKPRKSVREGLIPGLWTSTRFFKEKIRVAGAEMSLDDIEHRVLRPTFADPRVHFALVCASMGCPPLERSAYTEANVQRMLDRVTRDYLNSPRGTRMDAKTGVLYLSRIFQWFEEDFVGKSGSVEGFIRPYLEKKRAGFLSRKPRIRFLPYDWSLNARKPGK